MSENDLEPLGEPGVPQPEEGAMSALPAITANDGDIIQAVVRGKLEGQDCINVLYFRANDAVQDILTALLVKVAACIIANLIPHLSNQYRLERIVGRVVSPVVGPETWWTPDADDVTQGALATGGTTSFTAAVISIRSLRGGRSGRGRMFIGGVPEAATINSQIDPNHPMWAGLIAFVNCLLSQFHSNADPVQAPLSWGIMSRKIGGKKPPFAAAGFAGIIHAAPNVQLGSMNSRKVGRGS